MKRIQPLHYVAFIFCLAFTGQLFGQFSAGTEYHQTNSQHKDVAYGDMDNDGLEDLVTSYWGTSGDKILWYKNLGDSRYAQPIEIGTAQAALRFHLIDLDQDGDLDVFASSVNNIRQFENLGDGTFSNLGAIILQSHALSVAHDIDNDGDLDLILGLASGGNDVTLYENNAGAFSSGVVLVSVPVFEDFLFQDIDGDNLDDLLYVASFPGQVGWSKNLGSSNFGPIQTIGSSQTNPNAVSFGDMDNDGDIDVVSGSESDQTIIWTENLGSGTFGGFHTISTTALSVDDIAVADLDGDNFPEVISNHFGSGMVRPAVYKSTNGTNFGLHTIISNQFSPEKIVIIDQNSDGFLDVASVNGSSYGPNFNNGIGNANFGKDHVFSISGSGIEDADFKDVDLDGDYDILAFRNDGAFWRENLGDSTYNAVMFVLPSPWDDGFNFSTRDLVFDDFNNDGLQDLVYMGSVSGGSNPSVILYPNLGLNNFGAYVSVTTDQVFAVFGQSEDLDGDGLKDLLIGSGNEAAWYKNQGNFNFGAKNSLGPAVWCRAMEVGDLNNDGNDDIVYISENDDEVLWCENLGTSYAAGVVIASSCDNPNGIDLADLDNDNDLDLCVASRDDDKIAWFPNDGNGSFGAENIVSGNTDTAFDVWAEDFDLDGDMDLLTVGLNDPIAWHENLNAGVFGPEQTISPLVIGTDRLHCADVDGDGDTDILEANFSYNSLRVYTNYNIAPMQIKGRLFVDDNQNAQYNSSEVAIPQLSIQSSPTAAYSYSYPDGRYIMLFDAPLGNYTITADSILYWDNTTPSSYTLSMSAQMNSYQDIDFGFYPDTLADSLEIAMVGGFPRCNQPVNYWFDMENIGTTFPSGIIQIELDDSLTFLNSNVSPDSIVGQTYYWSYDSLDYFETQQIEMSVLMPDFNSIGDEIVTVASVFNDSLDTLNYHVIDTLEQILVCAYDPNDKQATPVGGTDSLSYIWPVPNEIEYLIRFQNTGNDTALTVIIRDQLDANLVWPSLRPIAASHSYRTELTLDGEVSFIFEDIMLPDSNVNEPASHGFILFSIETLGSLPIESTIENTAGIFFDFNPAIITNTVVHVFDTLAFVDDTSSNQLSSLQFESFNVYPNPFDDQLIIDGGSSATQFSCNVMDLSGQIQFSSGGSSNGRLEISLSTLSSGLYMIQILDDKQKVIETRKVIRK